MTLLKSVFKTYNAENAKKKFERTTRSIPISNMVTSRRESQERHLLSYPVSRGCCAPSLRVQGCPRGNPQTQRYSGKSDRGRKKRSPPATCRKPAPFYTPKSAKFKRTSLFVANPLRFSKSVFGRKRKKRKVLKNV